jgi:hypothetical protein
MNEIIPASTGCRAENNIRYGDLEEHIDWVFAEKYRYESFELSNLAKGHPCPIL